MLHSPPGRWGNAHAATSPDSSLETHLYSAADDARARTGRTLSLDALDACDRCAARSGALGHGARRTRASALEAALRAGAQTSTLEGSGGRRGSELPRTPARLGGRLGRKTRSRERQPARLPQDGISPPPFEPGC